MTGLGQAVGRGGGAKGAGVENGRAQGSGQEIGGPWGHAEMGTEGMSSCSRGDAEANLE